MTASPRLPLAFVWQESDVTVWRSTPLRPSQTADAEAASAKGPSPREVVSDSGQKKATHLRGPVHSGGTSDLQRCAAEALY